MKRKVRVAHFGIGRMGKTLVRNVVNHGGEVVAAFDTYEGLIGQDVGEVSGVGALGTAISDLKDADAVLSQVKADICMLSTVSDLHKQLELCELCARNGCNIITICPDMFWPWTAYPWAGEQADAIAKKYGVTIGASGALEVVKGTLAATLAACSARVDKIRIEGTSNMENYGGVEESYREHGIGLTMDEYQEKFGGLVTETDGHWPCLPGDQNGWVCDYLGLKPVRQYAKYEPIVADEDVWSNNAQKTIPKGYLLGMYLTVTTETEEGVDVELALSGHVFKPGEKKYFKVSVYGDPTEQTIISYDESEDGDEMGPAHTCSTPVHRIPDVINARPGFLMTSQFPRGRYLFHPMNEYVERED